MTLRRRSLLGGAALAPLAACVRAPPFAYDGRWIGADAARGHRLRERKAGGWPAPERQRRAAAIVVGAGIAGLSAARALAQAGIDDLVLFDLEDEPGGNSRGHAIAGMRCPLGAHYLPLPDDRAVEVVELLEALGLRRTERGVPVYDEATLCHSPQERLYIEGAWHEGLLPPLGALPAAERAATLAQYRRFGALVEAAGADSAFTVPTARSPWRPALARLDAVTFSAWLDDQALTSRPLRWYLDYCCRDDYGAGASQVSAWAGLHYFASRHGFHAPGDARDEHDAVLTWPEGNAWLARRLAELLRERIRPACVALRVVEGANTVAVDVWNDAEQHVERWTAPQVVVAVPLFIAVRLLDPPPAALVAAAAAMPHAPWLVANLHLADALAERRGEAPLSWDNVVYDPGAALPSLGYVDAMHQSTRSLPGPTVLTAYWALGGRTPTELLQRRGDLLAASWADRAREVVASLAPLHPDLPATLRRVDLMRYGHAMAVPVPGLRGSAALAALAESPGRVRVAHSDLAGYSVFEEACYHGTRAGRSAAAALHAPRSA